MLLGCRDTDQTWEYFGKHDPYFGVLVEDEFKRSNLTSSSKERFFQSGFDRIEAVFAMVRDYVVPSFCPRSALDFGCGVGRLVVPLARQCTTVLGVDISDSMLEEAKLNCDAHGISNAYFSKADDNLSRVSEKFDFIHSFIVFQHIPVKRGMKIVEGLLDRLEDGGVGVLHFTYACERTWLAERAIELCKWTPMYGLINLLKGRPFSQPLMQMNEYSLNNLLRLVQSAGAASCHLEFTRHGNANGVILAFQKHERRRRMTPIAS